MSKETTKPSIKTTTQSSIENIGHLNNNRMSYLLTSIGILLLVFSFISPIGNNQILMYSGMTFILWAILLLYSAPLDYVKRSLMIANIESYYKLADRILNEYEVRYVFCIPPYPKDVFIPNHLRGLQEYLLLLTSKTHV